MEERSRKFYNQSLERALNILRTFTFEEQEFTLTELARIQKLPKSTASRLVSTLADFGFLKYDKQSRCYSLGLTIIELGNIGQNSLSIRKVAFPFVSRLQASLEKTVFVGVLWDDELVYIERKDDSRDTVRFGSERGRRRPPYFGMLGQVLMAFLPEHEVHRILTKTPLTRLTRKSITRSADFQARLRKIADQGYLVEEGEAFDGISGVAAPIREAGGKVVAGVGVGFISSVQNTKEVRRIMREVCETADAISRAMGYDTVRRPGKPLGEPFHRIGQRKARK
jgi:IclR family transcriptional regulator, KDG regulon repressor